MAITKTFLIDEDLFFFVHSSGGMFVYIPNYYNNYSIRSRHTSSNMNTSHAGDSSSTKSSLILNKTNDLLLNKSHESNKRERLTAQMSENSDDSSTTFNNLDTSSKTSFNTSLNNSYVSGSHMMNGNNNTPIPSSVSTTTSAAIASSSTGSRDRSASNMKFQHLQFLKLNEKNYPPHPYGQDMSDGDAGNMEEVKNDLLFKPKLSNQKLNTNKNEKIDQIQHQQQKEQMLLQSFVVSNSSSYQKYSNQINDKKIPFYTDSETFVGYLWSWNFMLGRRWRSQYTGDEQLQDNMLADFRLFCSNQDGRLERFFKESKGLLK